MSSYSVPPDGLDANEEFIRNESASISDVMLDAIVQALHEDDAEAVRNLVIPMHAADVAELLTLLNTEQRHECMEALREVLDPDILAELSPDLVEEVIETLGPEKSAEAIAQLDTDDAVYVMEGLEESDQHEILEALTDAEYRGELREGLAYPESSAGRLMQTTYVSVPEFWTVGDTIDYLRRELDLPDDFYTLTVMDPRFKPVGSLLLSRIMQNKRETPIRDIMSSDMKLISTEMDQEDVALMFRKYGLVEAPVVNEEGRQVGVITVDDIVHVIAEEGEEDFMKAGGVSGQDLHADLLETVKLRLPWLIINLGTAILASFVVSRFEDAIEKLVVLAVLMPIIASMSGNAGIQTVTVAVRGLAAKEIKQNNMWALMRKELGVGLLNGLVLGGVTMAIITVYLGDFKVAAVFSCALLLVMMVSGIAGFAMPLILERFKIDPATAAGVFLTTFTDVASFFVFLGLASWVL